MRLFGRFFVELAKTWWFWLCFLLGAGSTVATYLAGYIEGFHVPWWVPLVVSIGAWIFAPFGVYREKMEELERMQQQLAALPLRRSELVIHAESGTFYRQVDPNSRQRVIAVYFPFRLVIENKGTRNSVINRYDLAIEGSQCRYNGLHPEPRNAVQTRRTQFLGLSGDFLPAGDVIRVPAENALAPGVIPICVHEDVLPDAQQLTCQLTLTDTEGVSATGIFVVSEAGA